MKLEYKVLGFIMAFYTYIYTYKYEKSLYFIVILLSFEESFLIPLFAPQYFFFPVFMSHIFHYQYPHP